MLPGEHVIIVGTEVDALRARAAGLSLRDTILILLPGVTTLAAYLFRSPLDGTVADNMSKHGCGGLNIDGCRVTTTDNLNGGAYSHGGRAAPMSGDQRSGASLGMFEPGRSAGIYRAPSGRWPTNLVLVHGQGCTTKACQANCPVRLLDRMSGITQSVSSMRGERHGAVYWGGKGTHGPNTERGHTDCGTASRFYPRFPDLRAALEWLDRLVGSPR